MNQKKSPRNPMQTFGIIWFGQLVSMMGTFMTGFALIIWAYAENGNATTIALMGFFLFGGMTITGPIAGIWADRFDRRKLLILVDLVAGSITITLLILFQLGELRIWHLYAAQLVDGVVTAIHYPTYSAVISVLLPRKHYSRANGLRALSRYSADIGAPVLAGALLGVIGIQGIMLIDIATFIFAVTTLLWVRFPESLIDERASEESGSVTFREQLAFGFRYIFARRGLTGLMFILAGINLFAALTYFALLPPMILARTGGDELSLAMVQASIGFGGVIGALLLSVWGGPRRQIHSVLGAASISFLIGDLTMAIGQSPPIWMFSGFIGAVFIPFIVGGNLSIWQAKVAPAIQGRVLAVQSTLRNVSTPIGYLLGGVLADYVFEPAMSPGGVLAGGFGWMIGTGPGAGMAFMFLLTAIAGCAVSAYGYVVPDIRNVEDNLPDHEASSAQRLLPNEDLVPVITTVPGSG